MTLPFTSPPASICILRLSAIGDVVHMVPVVHTLQGNWPDCKITWIIGKSEASLVADLPGVEFIIFDKRTGLKGLFDLRRQLVKRRFDLLLHMQVALRASLLSLCVPAKTRLGFDRERAHDYQWLFSTHRINAVPRRHVLDGFFYFLETIGIHDRCLEWNIPIPEAARHRINTLPAGGKPLLVINACSSARRNNWRNWPAERYAAVADYAAEQLGMQVVLSGGPNRREVNMALEIDGLSRTPCVNLVGQTTLKELLALLDRAAVLIAPDTGPAHMATATGTPVIGLYASSNPLRTGPYLSQKHVVNYYPQALMKYSGKTVEQARWGERVRHPDAMRLIPVEEVIQQLNEIMTEKTDAETATFAKPKKNESSC